MNKQDFFILAIVITVGYVVCHGHRLGNDCWLCQYRGLAFVSGVSGLGILAAYND